jgi:hypothetical protein
MIVGFVRVVRLLFGVPSGDIFLARRDLFGLAITSAAVAFSTGFVMLVTAVTSVGSAVDDTAGLVYAVCGSSNGGGASASFVTGVIELSTFSTLVG